jgi:glucokinase
VGGTKIAAAVVTPEGTILKETRYPTPASPKRLVESIVRAVLEVKEGFEVGGACLAVAGLILSQENRVVFSPNLHAVEDRVFVTLGTGVGGGVISHGVLLRGAQGSGGELGHVTIQATGPRCACGNRGCLEALASGTAISRCARELASEKPNSALGRLASERKILGEDVTRLAREGDELALSVLEEAGRWLGIGLAGFVNIFNPEVVAVGGGVVAAGELILKAAREEVYLRARPPSRDLAEIKEATLGPESGVLGAAALARDPSSGEYVLGS